MDSRLIKGMTVALGAKRSLGTAPSRPLHAVAVFMRIRMMPETFTHLGFTLSANRYRVSALPGKPKVSITCSRWRRWPGVRASSLMRLLVQGRTRTIPVSVHSSHAASSPTNSSSTDR